MKQSLFNFDDEPCVSTTIDNIKINSNKMFIKYEDLVFSPVTQMLCQNCGMFGRTFRCPPFTMPYYKTREQLKEFNKFMFIISESNKENVLKRYRQEIEEYHLNEWHAWYYAGTQANAINIGNVRRDLRTIAKFIRSRFSKYVFYDVGGGCLRCKPCKKKLKMPCAHPFDSFPSPEGSGIDLYQTLRNLGYELETPPKTKYFSLAMVCWKEE